MKKYLSYMAEPERFNIRHKENYYSVDYYDETPNSITLRLNNTNTRTCEFDHLVEDLYMFSQNSHQLSIKTFAQDGHYKVLTIHYKL